MPRSLVHLLLSVLLLVTQQQALLHATAHAGEAWHPVAAGAAAAVPQAAVLEAQPAPAAIPELCALCVDGAQVAFALPATPHAFVVPVTAHDRPAPVRAAAAVPPAAPAFLPRGPPSTA